MTARSLPAWAADTQRQIIAEGKWPKGLPVPDSLAIQQAFAQLAKSSRA